MEGGIIIETISQNDLREIHGGGGLSFWVIGGLIALGAFVVGVFEGIANPEKCG